MHSQCQPYIQRRRGLLLGGWMTMSSIDSMLFKDSNAIPWLINFIWQQNLIWSVVCCNVSFILADSHKTKFQQYCRIWSIPHRSSYHAHDHHNALEDWGCTKTWRLLYERSCDLGFSSHQSINRCTHYWFAEKRIWRILILSWRPKNTIES